MLRAELFPEAKNVKFFAEKDLKNRFISANGMNSIRCGSYKGELLWGYS